MKYHRLDSKSKKNDAPKDQDVVERKPPTPGFYKLGPAAQQAALSRAKNFYPFD